jgi:hypothetical protein
MLTFNFFCLYLGLSFIFFHQLRSYFAYSGSINRLNVFFFFIISFYLLQFLGLFFLFFDLDKFRSYLITDKNIIFQLLLIHSSILIYFLLINDLFNNKFIFLSKKIKKNTNSNFQNFIFILLIFFLVLFSLFLFNYIKTLPIIKYFYYEFNDITKLRQDYAYTPLKKYTDILFGTIFKTIFLIGLITLNLKKKKYLIALTLSFIILIFHFISVFQKFYVFEFFIQILLILLFSNSIDQKKISYKYIALSIVFFIFLFISFILLTGEKNLYDGFLKFMSRTFTGSLSSAYHYLEIFPNISPFVGNKILPNPFGVFNFETLNLSKLVKSIVFNTSTGSMPSLFWTDFYAGYYYSGLIIAVFLASFIFILIEISFNFIEKNNLTTVLYILLILECSQMSISFLSNFFFKIETILSILLVITLIEINKFFVSKKSFFYK